MNKSFPSNLYKFITDNMCDSFKKEYGITDEVLKKKAIDMYNDFDNPKNVCNQVLSIQSTGFEILDEQVGGECDPTVLMISIVEKYIGKFYTNDRRCGEYSILETTRSEEALLSYIRDGGKTVWFEDEEQEFELRELRDLTKKYFSEE